MFTEKQEVTHKGLISLTIGDGYDRMSDIGDESRNKTLDLVPRWEKGVYKFVSDKDPRVLASFLRSRAANNFRSFELGLVLLAVVVCPVGWWLWPVSACRHMTWGWSLSITGVRHVTESRNAIISGSSSGPNSDGALKLPLHMMPHPSSPLQ